MKYEENPYAKQSRYLKLKEGTTRVRLFNYVDGWEYWVDEGEKRSPRRTKDLMKIPMEKRGEAKHFYAYVIWNYDTSQTQIWSMTQRSLVEPLSLLFYDPDWGDGKGLSEFDVVITRTGEGLETEYGVIVKPKSPFKETLDPVNLDALFDNKDPFAVSGVLENDPLDEMVDEIDKGLKAKK